MTEILDEGGEGVWLGVTTWVFVRGQVMGIAWETRAGMLGGEGGGEMRTACEGRPRTLGWNGELSAFIETLPRVPS